MNLILDIGSSSTKLALINDDGMVEQCRIDGVVSTQQLQQWLDGKGIISAAILSSVARQDNDLLACLSNFPHFVHLDSDTPLPIKVAYKTPDTLGKDRLAAAVGAQDLYKGQHVLVVDAGTCITYDMIRADGQYLGGSISPGIALRFKSMHTHTANLPLVDVTNDVPLTSDNTNDALRSGVQHGVVAEVDGIIRAYKEQYNDLVVVVTGGDASFFDKNLKNDIFVAPEMVLYGLNIILEANVKP